MAAVLISALAGGLLLQLSAAELGLGVLTPVALAPALFVLARRPWPAWLTAGLVLGLMNAACLFDGAIKWGPCTAACFMALAAGQLALPFAAAGAVAPRFPVALRPCAFALAWAAWVWLVDEALYTPVLLGASLVPERLALGLVERIGIVGLELALTSVAAALAMLPRAPLRAALVAGLPLLGLLLPVHPERVGTARLAGVQPSVHWSTFSAAGWSLEQRRRIETRLDRLTARAAGLGDTIVWPENGNGLPNAQLDRRLRALSALLAPTGADLLAPSRELQGGREHLSVFRFSPEGVAARVRKTHLVPFAESGLEPGRPGVLRTRSGRLGIAICFDAVFSTHARSLVDGGAEALIVTTDDSSFGASGIAPRHLAYAVLRAAEVGRSLLFASNEGPSWRYDPGRHALEPLTAENEPTAYAVELPKYRWTTPAQRGTRHLVGLGALLLLVAVGLRPARTLSGLGRPWRAAIPAAVAAAAIGVALDAGLRVPSRRGGWAAVRQDFLHRAHGDGGMDALGPLYRQSQAQSCGATALAFALTQLGDPVFEEGIAAELRRRPPSLEPRAASITHPPASLADLEAVARARGFEAEAWTASHLAALGSGPGTLHILHMRWNHFVVAFQPVDDQIHVLDPAAGVVRRFDRSALERGWSGHALTLRHRPPQLRRTMVDKPSSRPS